MANAAIHFEVSRDFHEARAACGLFGWPERSLEFSTKCGREIRIECARHVSEVTCKRCLRALAKKQKTARQTHDR